MPPTASTSSLDSGSGASGEPTVQIQDRPLHDLTIRQPDAPAVLMSSPAPPVPAQPAAPLYGSSLRARKVVVVAPLSFARSGARIWKLVRLREETWARVAIDVAAIMLVWTMVPGWCLLWGLWLVPYRVVRRGRRRRKREALQHRELVGSIQDRRPKPNHPEGGA